MTWLAGVQRDDINPKPELTSMKTILGWGSLSGFIGEGVQQALGC